MKDLATVRRQLKIKTGVAKRFVSYIDHFYSADWVVCILIVRVYRLFKEHRSYVLEEEQQKIKLDKFIADNAEDWDIKNAVRGTCSNTTSSCG